MICGMSSLDQDEALTHRSSKNHEVGSLRRREYRGAPYLRLSLKRRLTPIGNPITIFRVTSGRRA
jgi:hypothetical protein